MPVGGSVPPAVFGTLESSPPQFERQPSEVSSPRHPSRRDSCYRRRGGSNRTHPNRSIDRDTPATKIPSPPVAASPIVQTQLNNPWWIPRSRMKETRPSGSPSSATLHFWKSP